MTGRSIDTTEAFDAWFTDQHPIAEIGYPDRHEPSSVIYVFAGSPDDETGATIYANDGIVNQWAEHYPSLFLAYARAAALVFCLEVDDEGGVAMFTEGPDGFTRTAEEWMLAVNFVTPPPIAQEG